ncbi:tRNA (adenosine(37)-N6)-dimethylallyltransferase MiaA [Secundilactobacillus folii]|uniref:tRNA dimethylallyltransferase n=1 Tax=Secundilactobacillus folii TaxID=2678357 RepID=A0A7X2XTZ9_9LACO|nr:tRNA (adenosine(37)-N6)-dimethylallyltransferase MiaA [Secundilactobacillus folii]MTV81055.1 tRNA (adenosine(37)-N6)-dimethylallyltransferase MiaA [Secundilactobacillus folii]
MKKVLAIIGPTAVGKTELSLELARKFNGEIISGDSMQVYRGLDIGTAKIMPSKREGIPHYLIDIRNVDQRYSVADFVSESQSLIESITARGGLPMVVGGTGFYLKALLYNMNLGGDSFDQSQQIRNRWHHFADEKGGQALWNRLNAVDPDAAAKIPVSNQRRVIRALEVYERTGTLFSKQQTTLKPRYDAFVIGLNTDRPTVYARINHRVDLMIQAGLLAEARQLFEAGGSQWQSGKGIGYRELFPYFKGEVSLSQATEKIKQDTRHYAKRQLTWFRHQIPVHWYDIIQDPGVKKAIISDISTWLGK